LACTPRPQATAVTALRAALGAALPAAWDDIWLLRFVLSFAEPSKRGASAGVAAQPGLQRPSD
jgi:hypothetical protein